MSNAPPNTLLEFSVVALRGQLYEVETMRRQLYEVETVRRGATCDIHWSGTLDAEGVKALRREAGELRNA